MDTKTVLKTLIEKEVPEILRLEKEIAANTCAQDEFRAQVKQLQVEQEVLQEQLTPRQEALLELMTRENAVGLTTPKYAIKRMRDANPTVEVVDLSLIPGRYLVAKPRPNKRLIQAEFVSSQTIPPGVKVQYGQYLQITERKDENG